MGVHPLSRRRLFWRVLGVAAAILLLRQIFGPDGPSYSSGGDLANHNNKDRPRRPSRRTCGFLQGIDNVFVIFKTGANEAPEKVPLHLDTTLRCIPHFEIYSDLEEEIAGHQVHNALDEVDPKIIAEHPDFEYYTRLQKAGREAFSEEEVAKWSAAQSTFSGRDSPGWRLDKWKFLPLAKKALKTQPDADWFVFMESDTYIMWSNMLEWLWYLDPHEPHYLGQPMQIGDVIFGYGGPGFILSKVALRMLIAFYEPNRAFYDHYTGVHWAGDCVLGKALADAGVELTWAWPNLFGEHPHNMDFNDTFGGPDVRMWCHHVASYHHLTSDDILRISDFEGKWRQHNGRALRHKDVFKQYVLPQLAEERPNWDNLADIVAMEHATAEGCRAICEYQPDCVQWSLTGHTCKLGGIIKLGRTKPETSRMTSGWMMDRVQAFMDSQDASCVDEDWITG
ncbi:hypothetical protein BX600DRAFT_510819 [Xylariales sp. PMI_506]|nr:hypothetical protein BX600DRAFT_510819 [Xylariales sp. PMI_506]